MALVVSISSTLLAGLRAGAAAVPQEICGLLFGQPDRIDGVEPTANVAADPSRQFEIDPAALIAAHRRQREGGEVLIGHYHSHPSGDPTPSAHDRAAAVGDGALWLILGRGEATLWRSDAPGMLAPVILSPT